MKHEKVNNRKHYKINSSTAQQLLTEKSDTKLKANEKA
jgi:hypothetical protein